MQKNVAKIRMHHLQAGLVARLYTSAPVWFLFAAVVCFADISNGQSYFPSNQNIDPRFGAIRPNSTQFAPQNQQQNTLGLSPRAQPVPPTVPYSGQRPVDQFASDQFAVTQIAQRPSNLQQSQYQSIPFHSILGGNQIHPNQIPTNQGNQQNNRGQAVLVQQHRNPVWQNQQLPPLVEPAQPQAYLHQNQNNTSPRHFDPNLASGSLVPANQAALSGGAQYSAQHQIASQNTSQPDWKSQGNQVANRYPGLNAANPNANSPVQPANNRSKTLAPNATSATATHPSPKPTNAASPNSHGLRSNPVIADEPKLGENFFPQTDHPAGDGTYEVPYSSIDFSPDPFSFVPFDPWSEADVYQGKRLNSNQRPLIELGKPFYQLGQLPVSKTFLGRTNLIHPRFQVFGDFRTAIGFNGNDGDFTGVWGSVLNLEMDLRITATERFHARVAPLDRAGQVTRLEFDYQTTEFFNNTDFEFDTGFFEGDLGALFGGMFNEVLPFDLPFTVGQIPLLFQNGITLNDAFIGFAATPLMARNSPLLDISNFDVVFFWGIDNITSPAFQGDDNAAKMYGFQFFLEMLNGYIETHYAFMEDRNSIFDRSYHNTGIAYTRRYGRFVSNSVRVIANAGQDAGPQGKTADGVLLLLENSLITKYPSRVIPYFNLFAGFGKPQSIARAGGTGGILNNTGITFETDGVTGLPTLDATANDAYGAALGINILAPEFTQQIVLEAAYQDVFGDDPTRSAPGREIGFGARYQLPISNAVIFRADAMHALRESNPDVTGFRVELRHKF